jgi:hypothetical protein
VFAIDIGSAIRGINAIIPYTDHYSASVELAGDYMAHLMQMRTPNNALQGYLLIDPDEIIPETWYTQPDAHHLKIVSGFLSLPPRLLDDEPCDVLQKTFTTWCHSFEFAEELTLDLVPTFHFLEGLIVLAMGHYAPGLWEIATTVYKRIMRQQTKRGYLPSNLVDPYPVYRSDVIAQALRVGCILRKYGYLTDDSDDEQLWKLYDSLLDFIGPTGGVSLFPVKGNQGSYWDTMATMYAYQALCLYCRAASRRAITREMFSALV